MKLYSDSISRIKNLFHSDATDNIPNPYSRIVILRWLRERHKLHGPSNVLGYHKIDDIIKFLQPFGFSEVRLLSEIKELILANCIISETHDENVTIEDLICISPSGFTHLDLLSSLDYLSACAEDVWFNNRQMATQIADRIVGRNGEIPLSRASVVKTSSDLIEYMADIRQNYLFDPQEILENEVHMDILDLSESEEMVTKAYLQMNKAKANIAKFKGKMVEGIIADIKKSGLWIELEADIFGFLASRQLRISKYNSEFINEHFSEGDKINVFVDDFDNENGNFRLKIPD